MLIAGAEIDGVRALDVRVEGERIAEIGRSLARRTGETVIHAAGGALLPGLHDHHLHLFALAASLSSVRCGPPDVEGVGSMARALASAAGSGDAGQWIRAVGYFESVAGELDRWKLDRFVRARPLRVQHRSGVLWILNTAAVERLGLDRGIDAPGVERDASGRATGRLFHLDGWLRDRLHDAWPPSLAAVGRALSSFGVIGVTDATPTNGAAELAAFVAASDQGELPQRLLVMGGPSLPFPARTLVERGALKLRLDESAPPDLDALCQCIAEAHDAGRAVAIHCVTRAELVLAAAALEAAGARPGDRIEHASVTPPDVMALLASLRVRVVTQPGFVRERGDAYAELVETSERPWLYRCAGFLEASIPLAAGTDAPFGDLDPWRAMQAAVDRRTHSGLVLGDRERITPERALALFTSPREAPGDAPRAIVAGACADLCLLDRPWSKARDRLSSECVAVTIRGGSVLGRSEAVGDDERERQER